MNSLVSIVIPAYNASRFIAETIDSVLGQSFKQWELIIVNDGSTDTTGSILETYSSKNPGIKVITKTNSGVSDSRNYGLKAAAGEYICFLDADDTWKTKHLETSLKILREKNADAVYSACSVIDEHSKDTQNIKTGEENIKLEDLLIWKANYITIPSGILFKKKVFEEIGGFDTSLSNNADQEILMRFLASGKKLSYSDTPSWNYRRHSKNMSSNISVMEKDTLKVYELADKKKFLGSPQFKRKCYAKAYLILAGSWWKDAGNKSRGLHFVLKALTTAPLFTLKELLSK